MTRLVAVLALSMHSAASAAESIEVSIASSPPGATVTLLKGLKRRELGITPVTQALEFHSEHSVLRVEVSHSGYVTEVVNVTPGKVSLDIALQAASWLRAPETFEDARLRAAQVDAQARLGEAWQKVFNDEREVSQDGEAGVRAMNGRILLVAPLSVPASYGQNPGMLAPFMMQLAAALRPGLAASDSLDGVALLAQSGGAVGVTPGTRQVTEMQCQGGMVSRSVWDTCATTSTTTSQTAYGNRVETKCVPGNVQRQVFDRCAYKVPVSKTEVDFKNVISTGDPDGLRWIIDTNGIAACRFENGKAVVSKNDASRENVEAVCAYAK